MGFDFMHDALCCEQPHLTSKKSSYQICCLLQTAETKAALSTNNIEMLRTLRFVAYNAGGLDLLGLQKCVDEAAIEDDLQDAVSESHTEVSRVNRHWHVHATTNRTLNGSRKPW